VIEVVRAGALTTVQDRGRAGWAHLGVPRSGALDRPALDRANRAVGNVAPAAGLEVTLTGCALRFRDATVVAVDGAAARVTVDGVAVPFGAPVRVPAGGRLAIGSARGGVRTYVAVRGGIDGPYVLGSRSTDTLSGLGPAPLRDGDTLAIGADCAGSPEGGADRPGGDAESGDGITVRIRFGPRDGWFDVASLERIRDCPYRVTVRSNRVGARLAGAPLTRAKFAELPSEGIVLGSVQVAPDGQPIVFLADHPTTGGYPVIGVVDERDLPLLAQARPGTTVRFHGPER
jgi:biotin-dependent carboxylase-like uncharacterized protein